MQIRNEIKIKTNNNTYIFHNTMTKYGFNAISNLKQYGKYLAIGTGRKVPSVEIDKLDNFHSCYKTIIADRNYNVCNGDLFLIRAVEICFTEDTIITELGLCDEQINPTLLNYVSIVDGNGDVSAITFNANERVYFEVKIILARSGSDVVFLGDDDNLLVSTILGATSIASTAVYGFLPGTCSKENYETVRNRFPYNPMHGLIPVVLEVSVTEIAPYEVTFTYTNIVEDVSFLRSMIDLYLFIDTNAVARFNISKLTEQNFYNVIMTSLFGRFDFLRSVKQINSLIDRSNNSVCTSYELIKHNANYGFATKMSLEINVPHTANRYVSHNGDKIAFIIDEMLLVYKNVNSDLIKLNASAFVYRADIKNIVMVDNFLFVTSLTENNVLDAYEFVDGVLIARTVDYDGASAQGVSFNVIDVDVTLTNTNEMRLAIVENSATNSGKCVVYTLDANRNWIYTSAITILQYCYKTLCVHKNDYTNDATILFLTQNYNNGGLLRIITYCQASTYIVSSQSICGYIITNTDYIMAKGNAILCHKTTGSFAFQVLFLPNFKRYYITKDNYTKIWVDQEFKNYFKIYADNSFKSFVVKLNSAIVSTASTFPSYSVPIERIVDMEYLNDILLIWTNIDDAKLIGVDIGHWWTSIKGLSSTAQYLINVDYYQEPGCLNSTTYMRSRLKIVIGGN